MAQPVDQSLGPHDPAAHFRGGRQQQDGALHGAEARLAHSRAEEQQEGDQEPGRPGHRSHAYPHDHGADGEVASVESVIAPRADDYRPHQRADALGRADDAPQGRAHLKNFGRDDRYEVLQGQHHAVHHQRNGQHTQHELVGEGMANARPDALPEGAVAAHHYRRLGQAQLEHQHGGHQVQRYQHHVGAGEPVEGDEQSAGDGTQNFAHVVGDGLQGHGVGDAVLPSQVEQRRPPGGVVQHLGRPLQQDGKEHKPGVNQVQEQQGQQGRGHQQVEGVDARQDAPTVQAVGQHPGHQGQGRTGPVEKSGDQPHLEGRVGEFVDEIAQDQQFHASGDFVDPARHPQQAEVGVLQDRQGGYTGK